MKKHRKPESFIPAPSYPGGNEALKKFIAENKKYPEEALKNRIEGAVRVKFDIESSGKVTRAEVLSGIGYGCDEEAKRLVLLLKFEPTKVRGVRVVHHKTININFKLPPLPSITYSYKSSGDKNKDSGGYTINLQGLKNN